jgi:hypothetical protein
MTMHEEASISAFASPERAERYLTLLKNRRGREKLRASLAHDFALDHRYATPVEGPQSSLAAIEQALRKLGALDTCYCLSENKELDGRESALSDALATTVGYGMGTLISCVPGVLAYYEGEGPNDRWILHRAAV